MCEPRMVWLVQRGGSLYVQSRRQPAGAKRVLGSRSIKQTYPQRGVGILPSRFGHLHYTQCLKKRLKFIEPTGHLNIVRHVTLAGPNSEGTFCEADIRKLCARLPNLGSIGVQCQDKKDQWKVGNCPFAPTESATEKRREE
jgi:hypothetical protein